MPPRSLFRSEEGIIIIDIFISLSPIPNQEHLSPILLEGYTSLDEWTRGENKKCHDSQTLCEVVGKCSETGSVAPYVKFECKWQYALLGIIEEAKKRSTKSSSTRTAFCHKRKTRIMSLHQHHQHHHHRQQQHPSEQPPPAISSSSGQAASAPQLASQQQSGIQRSSSTSPHSHTQPHHHHHSHTSRYSFHQHSQHRHLHHHYLPPRPPSTTSTASGASISTSTGFPDDLHDTDDIPIPLPPTEFSSSSASAFHTLQFTRHTSPHFPSPSGVPGSVAGSQQIHHHHHHHFVPPPLQPHSLQPVTPPPPPVPGGSYYQQHHHQSHAPGTAHSSRACSRQTFRGDEPDDDEPEEEEEENLLLIDNSVGVQDAVYLDPVTTDNFLTNVVQRFKREFIYTYVGEGTLLVSVNPYKPLSIFSPRVKAAYRNVCNPFQLPPHIYGQLCLILQRNVSSLERTQTLLLTGESGSGKTTNLSYLLDFLATKQEPSCSTFSSRSRRNSGRSTSAGSTRGGSYNLSTGSLHRHHQTSPYYYYQYYSSDGGGSGGGRGSTVPPPSSGRASSLSLTTPPSHPPNTAPPFISGVNMARLLLQGNFLLNCFGNCKTGKNCDASRFGKLVQLNIDFLGNVSSGRILTYQLEKWRVQGPISNNSSSGTPETPTGSTSSSGLERNFHIFYILLIGADSTTLKSLRLTRNLENYHMLNVKNHSSFLNASQQNPSTPFCPHDHYYKQKTSGGRHGSCYEGSFQLVKTTLASILSSPVSSSASRSSSSISPDHVFRMLAAILKLNNLQFAPVANIDGTEGCDVTNDQDLHDLGELLSIKPSSSLASGPPPCSPSPQNNNGNNNNHNNHQHPLKTILTTRKITRSDGMTTCNVELTASESSSLRNSLTISLYTRLFSWLTKQVSFSSSEGGGGPVGAGVGVGKSLKHNLLNIIDFYGFEVFPTNSIEQFLINFTNEKIQFVLADLRLRLLQEEFVKDGLEWITIDTAVQGSTSPGTMRSSNTSAPGKLIDLVEENSHGILSIFQNCGNDTDLEKQFQRRFASPSRISPGPKEEKEGAGVGARSPLVEYLHQSFRLRHWAGPVVYSTRHFATKNRDSLPPHLPHTLYTQTGDPLLKTLFSHDGRTSQPLDSTSRLLSTSNMELSLRNLFQKCSNKRIYYVRCLKPNELSQPEVCELALLKHQVRYHRLIDFVRVYREGFCWNMGAYEFLERYKLLSLNTWPCWRLPGEPRLGIQVLMKDLQMKEGVEWCFGGVGGVGGADNLKVYLKGQRILSELEDFRRERMDDLALLIQKIWRGWREKRRYERMKVAHGIICRAWRSYLKLKRKEQRKLWRMMRDSVKLIQKKYILWKRRLFLKQLITQVRGELQMIGGISGVGSGVGGVVGAGGPTGGCPGAAGFALLPSTGSMLSPISRDWPYSPSYLEEASFQLRRVFHRWRCRLYRSRFNEIERAKMAEKVTASLLFKDKKSSYSRSISHPFLGDYIRLRQNSQWRRTIMMMMLQSAQSMTAAAPLPIPTSGSTMLHGGDQEQGDGTGVVEPTKKQLLPSQQLQIVFADLINKITRSSGKFLPIVLVVTTTQIMILDPRTLNIKYKIPATEVWRLSMSPYGDDICVLHLQQPMHSGVNPSGGSVVGPGGEGNLFGGVLSDDDDPYYQQYGDEPSPTQGGNFGPGGCVCSSSVKDTGGGVGGTGGGAYYIPTGGGTMGSVCEVSSPSPQQHQCQPGSGGCGLFGGGADSDSGHYAVSEIVKLTKGDLVFHTCHLIEMVTKIYLVVKNATGKGPEIVISNEFPAVFNNQRVQLLFRYSKQNPTSQKGSSKQEASRVTTTATETPLTTDDTRPPPLPDGPQRESISSQQNPTLVPTPPPPPPTLSTLALPLREEPVIPPSQIKITRKKSTRMEFLIGQT